MENHGVNIDADHNIHILQDVGGRGEQQDRFLVVPVQDVNGSDLEDIFTNTHEKLDGDVSAFISGSTASLVFADLKNHQLTTANLGDSRVSLVTHNKTSHEFSIMALTDDDVPTSPHEKSRLEEASAMVTDKGRLVIPSVQASMALSAAFGDTAAGDLLRRTPLIKTHSLAHSVFCEDDEIFIVAESDGTVLGMQESQRRKLLKEALTNMSQKRELESKSLSPEDLSSMFTGMALMHMEDLRDAFIKSFNNESFSSLLEKVRNGAGDEEIETSNEWQNLDENDRIKFNEAKGRVLYGYVNDNMTLASLKIDLNNPAPSIVMGVFDGHGQNGGEIAEKAKTSFAEQLAHFAP